MSLRQAALVLKATSIHANLGFAWVGQLSVLYIFLNKLSTATWLFCG